MFLSLCVQIMVVAYLGARIIINWVLHDDHSWFFRLVLPLGVHELVQIFSLFSLSMYGFDLSFGYCVLCDL